MKRKHRQRGALMSKCMIRVDSRINATID